MNNTFFAQCLFMHGHGQTHLPVLMKVHQRLLDMMRSDAIPEVVKTSATFLQALLDLTSRSLCLLFSHRVNISRVSFKKRWGQRYFCIMKLSKKTSSSFLQVLRVMICGSLSLFLNHSVNIIKIPQTDKMDICITCIKDHENVSHYPPCTETLSMLAIELFS